MGEAEVQPLLTNLDTVFSWLLSGLELPSLMCTPPPLNKVTGMG